MNCVPQEIIRKTFETLFSQGIVVNWCRIFKTIAANVSSASAASTEEKKEGKEEEKTKDEEKKSVGETNIIVFLINLTSYSIVLEANLKDEKRGVEEKMKPLRRLVETLTTEEKSALKKYILDSPSTVDKMAKEIIVMVDNVTNYNSTCQPRIYEDFCYLLQEYPREIVEILRLAKDKIVEQRDKNNVDEDDCWQNQDYSFSTFLLHIIWNVKFIGVDDRYEPFEKMVEKALKNFIEVLTFQ
jgi:hypothetical protein